MPGADPFPAHGRLKCSICFSAQGETLSRGKWRFINDPGHWGSSNPTVLVLGFSKGANQANAYVDRPFEDVAFARSRDNLRRILGTLRLVSESEDFDRRFRAGEQSFAFASLLRCSAALFDKKGRLQTSGIAPRAFRDEAPTRMIETCTNEFLRILPASLRLVVMLGVQQAYINGCRKLIASIHAQNFQQVNAIAYATGQVTWVHVPHPSGSNNGYISAWLTEADDGPRGAMRELAKQAIRRTGDMGG